MWVVACVVVCCCCVLCVVCCVPRTLDPLPRTIQIFALFFSPNPLFVSFLQFPMFFVELRWSLRVFIKENVFTTHMWAPRTSCEAGREILFPTRTAPPVPRTAPPRPHPDRPHPDRPHPDPPHLDRPHPDCSHPVRFHPDRSQTTRQPTPTHPGGTRAGARVFFRVEKSFFELSQFGSEQLYRSLSSVDEETTAHDCAVKKKKVPFRPLPWPTVLPNTNLSEWCRCRVHQEVNHNNHHRLSQVCV